jgi:hypothetical protein
MASMKPRGCIGMQEGWLRDGLSGLVTVRPGRGESQGLVWFLAGVEGATGEVIERPNRMVRASI